jgi:uncharacterized protein YbjT (DUF2867 family)
VGQVSSVANLIRALRSRGDDVRALARTDAAIARVTALGATPVRGTLDDTPALRDGNARL